MAAEYQYLWDAMKPGEYSTTTILRTVDSAHIPNDPANRDYQGFCVWLEDGNVPDPPDPPPEPPPPEPVTLPVAMPEAPTDATPKAYVDSEIRNLEDEQIVPLRDRVTALEARRE